MAKKKMSSAKVKTQKAGPDSEKITIRTGSDTEREIEVRKSSDSKSLFIGNARFVNNLTKQNFIVYFSVALFPPLGLYLLWFRENTIPYTAKVMWTFIAFFVLYYWVMLLSGHPVA